MQRRRRTEWIEWACDLEDCDRRQASHKEFDETTPEGWVTIAPPPMWKGPSLAFCSTDHKQQFVAGYVRPLLTEGEVA